MPEPRNTNGSRLSRRLLLAVGLTAAAFAGHADNAALQDLFFEACENPTGALAARCAQTPGGLGNLSGDSESSLNPSQALGSTSAAYSAARERGEAARERAERFAAEPDVDGQALALGPFSLLLNGHYLDEERDRRVDLDAERGYDLSAWGAQLGFDYRVNRDVVAGALVSWETSDLDFDAELPGEAFVPTGNAGSVDQDSLGFAAFVNLRLGERGYADASAGYIDSDYTVRRRAIFQESGRTVPQTLAQTRGTPDGEETWAALAAGYAATAGAAWTLEPHLGLTWSKARVDGYEEEDLTGTGLAMSITRVTSRSLLGQAGLRVSRPVSGEGYVLIPQLNVEYLHEFERDGVDTRVAYRLDQNASSLSLEGDRRDGDYVEVGIGLVAVLPNGWMPFIEVQTTLGQEDLDRYRVAAGLRVEL
jgi:uncharacterized protein YhjY with autotransporter beta-barrel domain